jgi:hypothetical protein
MNYLVIARDQKDAFERRLAQRDAHLAGATQLKEEGKLIYAVAMIEEGKMVGSVMVFHFHTEQEFNDWKANEPYITGDVWGEIEITECAVPPLFQ